MSRSPWIRGLQTWKTHKSEDASLRCLPCHLVGIIGIDRLNLNLRELSPLFWPSSRDSSSEPLVECNWKVQKSLTNRAINHQYKMHTESSPKTSRWKTGMAISPSFQVDPSHSLSKRRLEPTKNWHEQSLWRALPRWRCFPGALYTWSSNGHLQLPNQCPSIIYLMRKQTLSRKRCSSDCQTWVPVRCFHHNWTKITKKHKEAICEFTDKYRK